MAVSAHNSAPSIPANERVFGFKDQTALWFSLGVGLLMASRPWGGWTEWRMTDTGWMVAGTALALLPWMAFILSDVPEFQLQFGAAVANQAWRYPPSALARTVINELPGRYLLDRQDYPVDWDPWSEATRLLVPAVSTKTLQEYRYRLVKATILAVAAFPVTLPNCKD